MPAGGAWPEHCAGHAGGERSGFDEVTRVGFGDYISVYDIQRVVQGGATVPLYYESRVAKLALAEAEKPKLDAGFEEVEGKEVERKRKLKTKWAQLEAVVGAATRRTAGEGSPDSAGTGAAAVA